ncbi:Protein CBG06285 [Trichuris trichiura]|uniref:glucuronosyltransferase n=1 Tax=Trichuris trichiura TaxID=36087 RepID=A0A077Z0C4_TRITR|nr:Protein CBG06285 [Trichuris trichiura]
MSGYWDLLLVDNVFHPCGVYLTSCAKNLSWIDYSTTLTFRRTRALRAINLPISTEPNMNMINYNHKSFKFRLTNTAGEMLESALGTVLQKLLPYWTEGKLKVRMNIKDFHRRAIYAFGSMSPMLDFALPQAANTFTIDYSCPKPAALGNDFQELVDDPSSKGTIIVSFGHYVKWKYATTEILQSISNVFINMTDYRIVWQYDGDKKRVANKAHVKLAAWLPLPALLKHPKTVLFINHVGIKSLHEAVCFAVPVVAIPMFGDQYRNAALIRQRRLGIFLEKTKMNEFSFRSAIEAILHQPTYKKNMKTMSAMTKDKIIDDLEKGKFWIDFYLRHPKAATHMKLKGVDFCNFTYFDIDLVVALSALFFLLVEVLQKCCANQ